MFLRTLALNAWVMIQEVNIPWPLPITPDELRIPWRPLRLRIARQHALNAYAYALDIMHWAPALRV